MNSPHDLKGGGVSLSRPAGVVIIPTDVSQVAADGPTASEALGAMRARFLADFANGTIGRHRNPFRQPSRVVRRMTEADRPSPVGPQPR